MWQFLVDHTNEYAARKIAGTLARFTTKSSCKSDVHRSDRCTCTQIQAIIAHHSYRDWTLIHLYTGVHTTIHRCIWVYTGIHGVTRGYIGVHGVTQEYTGLRRYTRRYTGVRGYTRRYMGTHRDILVHRYTRVYTVQFTRKVTYSRA